MHLCGVNYEQLTVLTSSGFYRVQLEDQERRRVTW